MELELFSFVKGVTECLESSRSELLNACKDIELYFEEILSAHNEGHFKITSRVKSTLSLKEKILRNSYYKKYKFPEQLIANLSDLIGIRVECRFIEDENEIYKVLRKHFSQKNSEGYYYNSINKNIRLELESEQPQKQKNGFEIFRIDGLYENNNKTVNFELQIKSLVNVFWGEIEHKVIYKNSNYTLGNQFLKNIMLSIKENLLMIDNQLLAIDNQFNKMNAIDPTVRKGQLETLLAKIIYDIYSTKMKNSIGFIVDFRDSCDTIMKYIFRTNNAEKLADYSDILLKTLARLNDISKNDISFNSEIKFERKLCFEDEFCNIIGNTIVMSINNDFKWNLFFRILFEIELGNNAEDFETFMKFIKNRFYSNKSFAKLYLSFDKEEANKILNLLMKEIAYSFKIIDSIKFIYDNSIEEINKIIDNIVVLICENVSSYEEWEKVQDTYLENFRSEILSKIQ